MQVTQVLNQLPVLQFNTVSKVHRAVTLFTMFSKSKMNSAMVNKCQHNLYQIYLTNKCFKFQAITNDGIIVNFFLLKI